MKAYTSLGVFFLGAIALIAPSGYAVGPAMLLLGSGVLLVKRPSLALGRQEWMIVAVLLAYAALCSLEIWWDDQPATRLYRPSWLLFAIPSLLLLLAYPPRAAFLWSGLAIGGMATGTWAVWQTQVLNTRRARGFVDAIQFGDLSMLLGLLCLAGLGWAFVQPRARSWWVLLLLGAGFGILGSLLSGSRGGWIVAPFALAVLYRSYGHHLSRRVLAGLAAAIVVTAGVVYAIPQLGVQERIQRIPTAYVEFVEQDDPTNSVGGRLEMWYAALILIPEKPLLGWGLRGYDQARERLISQGRIHPSLARFDHVHNDYLDAWLKRGLLGLLALLALYLVPLRLFARYARAEDIHLRAFAIAGVLLPVAYMSFGLTQTFLAFDSGVVMYAFLLVVLWAGLQHRERTITAPS